MASEAQLRGSSWLEGPFPDLLIGAGGAYLLSVPILGLALSGAVATDWTFTPIWIIAILINGPHYGATLLRVYEQREERHRYALFAIWGTLLCAALFVVGLYEPYVGALIVTVYFSWAPWHFAGQNYGISLMFLRRSGVEISPLAKRLLYASFVLSFVLAFLALHIEGATGVNAPPRSALYSDAALLRLGIPDAIAGGLILACLAAYLICVFGAVAALARRARFRELFPVLTLVLCQALWFSIPALLDATRAWSVRSLAFAAIWISAAHSMQYLWVTFHYAKRSAAHTRLSGYLLKTTLAGNAAIVVPGILFAPMLLGTSLTWEAGLSTLVFAVINIHHFMLDGAIWKLRDGRVARALLRDRGTDVRSPAIVSRSRWRRPSTALWAIASVCFAIEIGELVRHQSQRWGANRTAKTMFTALGWAGREHPIQRIRFGRSLLKQGDYAAARIEFERVAREHPSVGAWGGLGRALEGEHDFAAAADAYEAGLALAPDDTALLRSAAITRSRLGEYGRAMELLAHAAEVEPNNPLNHQMLERTLRKIESSAAQNMP